MRFRSARAALLLGVSVLLLALAVPALAATSVSWKDGTNRTVNVKRGATVRFVWADKKLHNVVGNGIASRNIKGRGKSWSHRFTSSVTLYCAYHGNMVVRVNVRR